MSAKLWPVMRLDELAEIVSGLTLGGAPSQEPTQKVPYLRVANVKDGSLMLDDIKEINATKEDVERLQLRRGDVVLTEGGDPDKLGRGTVWREEIPLCLHQNHIFRVRFETSRVCPEFAAYQFASVYGKTYFLAHARQTTGIASINKGVLSRFPFCVPLIDEQRRVASRLRAQIAVAQGARQAASDAFKNIHPLLDKTIAESFHGITPLSVGRDEAPAPEGWRWQSLLDLARLATGHTPSRRYPEYWADGDIPWLALPDIRALDCRVATETSEKTNALGIANSSARVLPPGTVALSRTASVGFVTMFGCEMATSQDFVNWVCGPELHAPFLLWLLRASRAFIKGVSTGAVHQTVYMDAVERFRVCLPDLPTQQKIAARLDAAFRLIQQLQSAHEAQLEALDKLPGAYLREAFGSL